MSEQATESTTEQGTEQGESGQVFDAAYVSKLRAEAAKYRTEAKSNADAAKRLTEIEEQSKSDTEKAITSARTEEALKVRAEVLVDRVLDRVEVLAAKDFADPEDARLRLAANAGEFVKDGKPDGDAIKSALSDLLKNKPHLAAQATGRPAGDVGQGARGSATTASGPAEDFARHLSRQLGQ